MPEHFSLVRRAWIPVVRTDGQRVFVRPCEISQTHEGHALLRVASGRPDCDISLTEFLIGLLAVAMPPNGVRDWQSRYHNPPTLDQLDPAFAVLEPAMSLDGDGARFLQDKDELPGEAIGVEALFMDAPAAHFVKQGRFSTLSRAGAALALLTLQTSAPAGGAGHRTSLRGGGPLTTLVLPGQVGNVEPTLWQRLWANVPDRAADDAPDLDRVFPWLKPTRISDKTGVETMPGDVDPVQCFFGMPRRIRLTFAANTDRLPCDLLGIVDDVIVTGYVTRPWGTNYTAWSRGHPLSPYYRPKKDVLLYLPLHLQSSRVGYRQCLGMILRSEGDQRLPARCVSDFFTRAQEFALDEMRAALNSRLLVAGYAMDNMKPLDFGEALMPLIVTGDPARDGFVHEFAEHFVTSADSVARELSKAVNRALYGEKGKADNDSTVLEVVRQRFWVSTEQDFYKTLRATAEVLIEAGDDVVDRLEDIRPARGKAWRNVLMGATLTIFDSTVPIEDADSDNIKHVIAGRRMLIVALKGTAVSAALWQPVDPVKPKKGRKAA